MEQLEQDIRVLRRTDMGEVLLKKKPGVPSGNEVVGNGIQINTTRRECRDDSELFLSDLEI